jgi:tRNA(fMet)-specific endonuclease VapC
MPSSERRKRLLDRVARESQETFGIPIVVVEETMRGWLAAVAKERQSRRQIAGYRELSRLFEFFAAFPLSHFDEAAADRFDSLKAEKIRIASRDLKIAAIVLAGNALLLTANRRDFESTGIEIRELARLTNRRLSLPSSFLAPQATLVHTHIPLTPPRDCG